LRPGFTVSDLSHLISLAVSLESTETELSKDDIERAFELFLKNKDPRPWSKRHPDITKLGIFIVGAAAMGAAIYAYKKYGVPMAKISSTISSTASDFKNTATAKLDSSSIAIKKVITPELTPDPSKAEKLSCALVYRFVRNGFAIPMNLISQLIIAGAKLS
jgi:hypothetical protein